MIHGRWLDAGCAEGHYTDALRRYGASEVVGLDPLPERIASAQEKYQEVTFRVGTTEQLPFPESYFDGILCNEVFEHVEDETETLREFRRVLRPRAPLVLMSPNRWFPFECHEVRFGPVRTRYPTPLIPWLPRSLTDRWTTARNYWPWELRKRVEQAGFVLEDPEFVLPVLELYPWLPRPLINAYQRQMTTLQSLPVLRRVLGVSSLIVAMPSPDRG